MAPCSPSLRRHPVRRQIDALMDGELQVERHQVRTVGVGGPRIRGDTPLQVVEPLPRATYLSEDEVRVHARNLARLRGGEDLRGVSTTPPPSPPGLCHLPGRESLSG